MIFVFIAKVYNPADIAIKYLERTFLIICMIR